MVTYNSVLTEIINKHAPLKTKQIKFVPEALWFDAEYITLLKLGRIAEKKLKKTGFELDKNLYVTLCKQTTNVALEKKTTFKLEQGSSSKTLSSVVNELIDNKKDAILPSSKSDKELANSFLTYFKEKIENIHELFNPSPLKVATENPNAKIYYRNLTRLLQTR